jgi:hypothetical protein
MGSPPTMKKLSVIEGGPLDRLQRRLGLMKLEAPLIVRRALPMEEIFKLLLKALG